MQTPLASGNGTAQPRFRIDDLVVDIGKAEVSRGDEKIGLPKLSFDLLYALIRAAPAIVTNDDLLEQVWPGLQVTSESVAQRVKLLRSALGDDSQQPRYILGVRGRGYRLVPAVERLAELRPPPRDASNSPVNTSSATIPEQRISQSLAPKDSNGSPKRVIIAAAVLLAVGVAVWAGWYSWSSNQNAVQPSAAAMADKSIAVLPFVDMSEKKDQEYFGDGMAEELISSLAKLPELRVPARTSSFYFKGRQATVADIARSLGVEYVLEGSVRKSGTMLRTTVELVRASSGYHVRSQTYDRELRDVFKVQDEIAMAVVKALKISLLAGSIPGEAPTVNPEAYALYLEARFLERRDASGDYAPAVTYLKKALNIDMTFSLAWAELALAHTIFFDTFTSVPAKEIRREAVESVNKALALNPNLPEAHLAMAKILSHIDWDWSGAESEFNRVLELDSANSDALLGLAKISAMNGRLDQTLALCQRVIAQDPLNDLAYFSLAGLQSRRGDYKQAEVARRKVLELNPTGATGHFWLGYALLAQGKPTEALEEMQKEEDATIRKDGTVLALDALGRTKEAELLVAQLERNPESASANIAAFYACRKDADRAFVWLERAYVLRDYYITGIGADFCFNKLRADPRYKAFLRKMKLTE